MIKKFYEIYVFHEDKEEFISFVMGEFPDMKYASAQRRWYECKKHKLLHTYPDNEKSKPTVQKMILYNDLKKFHKTLTRKILYKQHFSPQECNWLEENKNL